VDIFKKYVHKDLEVRLSYVVVMDVVLELEAVGEVVTAVGAAPLVETASTQLGAVMNSTAIVELPLNARDTYQLLQLQKCQKGNSGVDIFYRSETTNDANEIYS